MGGGGVWGGVTRLRPVSLTLHELFSRPVAVSLGPPAPGPPPHADTEPHQQDELMNSELDGVKLGMSP